MHFAWPEIVGACFIVAALVGFVILRRCHL